MRDTSKAAVQANYSAACVILWRVLRYKYIQLNQCMITWWTLALILVIVWLSGGHLAYRRMPTMMDFGLRMVLSPVSMIEKKRYMRGRTAIATPHGSFTEALKISMSARMLMHEGLALAGRHDTGQHQERLAGGVAGRGPRRRSPSGGGVCRPPDDGMAVTQRPRDQDRAVPEYPHVSDQLPRGRCCAGWHQTCTLLLSRTSFLVSISLHETESVLYLTGLGQSQYIWSVHRCVMRCRYIIQ